jgi:hypothetical protein
MISFNEISSMLQEDGIKYSEIQINLQTNNVVINIDYYDINPDNLLEKVNQIVLQYTNIQFNLIKTY